MRKSPMARQTASGSASTPSPGKGGGRMGDLFGTMYHTRGKGVGGNFPLVVGL